MSTNSPMPLRAASLYCPNCGAAVTPGDQFCSKCSAQQPRSAVTPYGAPVVATGTRYAGFWIRFVAWVLDVVIISIGLWPVRIAIFAALGMSVGGFRILQDDPVAWLAVVLPALTISVLLSGFTYWLYEAFLTSSSKQATIGKMACGLKVTDLQGRRISFARATGRHFAKILSSITLLIGYIMAGFTERKQALHDMVAGTYVLKG